MNQIIGRDYEEKVLKSAFRSDKAEFISVVGRRRAGKTYLIKICSKMDQTPYFFITGIMLSSK